MTWYTGIYGSWKDGTVHYLEATFNRKEIFKTAQNIANEIGMTVTIQSTRGTLLKFFEVRPE